MSIFTKGASRVYAKVYNSTPQSINSGAYPVAILFNSEVEDALDMHSNVSNTERLTCVSAGLYLILASISWYISAVGFRDVEVWKNGTLIAQANCFTNSAVYHTIVFVSTIIPLAENDYIWISGYQDTGGALAADAGEYITYLSAVKISN